ncbi:MAG: hypothetical protein K6B75_05155, partial [Lachnospiraceae bacterium]|nr:hypothetical protein [Lachnospiraceae bacterium]
MEWKATEFASTGLGVSEGSDYYVDESRKPGWFDEGQSERVLSYGPYMHLDSGQYTLEIHYSATGEGNFLGTYSNQLLNEGFHNNRTYLDPNDNTATLSFYLPSDIDDFEVQTVYGGNGSFSFSGIKLWEEKNVKSSNNIYGCMVRIFALILFFAFCNVVYLYFSKNKKEVLPVTVLAIFAVLVSSPSFNNLVVSGHDIAFHIGRIYGLRAGLLNGTIFPKFQPEWYNGYGYIVGAMYGDVLLMFPAVLNIAGVKMQTAFQAFCIFINILTALVSYFCFKGIFKKQKVAFIGAFLYTGAFYRIMDIYLRHAVGEYGAFVFYPLLLYGFYLVLTDEALSFKETNKGWLVISVGLAGLLNTHVLSTWMAAIFVVLGMLISIKRAWRIQTVFHGVKAGLATFLLGASFLIPFVDAMLVKGGMNINSYTENSYPLKLYGIGFAGYFEM